MKRQRGRGRGKSGGNQGNRSFESNGPDVKIRGNASTIHEKYMQLARDASSSGDRVMAENYYQHADHYFRIVAVQQAEQEQRRQARQQQQDDQNRRQQNRNQGSEDDNASDNSDDKRDQSGQQNSDQNENERPRRGRRPKRQSAEDKRDPLEVVDPEKGSQSEMASDEASDDQPRPRRGRRPRKAAGDDSDGGSETEAA
jgi:hypothetical protein